MFIIPTESGLLINQLYGIKNAKFVYQYFSYDKTQCQHQ